MWFAIEDLDCCICIADAYNKTRPSLYMTKKALLFLKGYIPEAFLVDERGIYYKGHPIILDATLNSDNVIAIPTSIETIYYSWRGVRNGKSNG